MKQILPIFIMFFLLLGNANAQEFVLSPNPLPLQNGQQRTPTAINGQAYISYSADATGALGLSSGSSIVKVGALYPASMLTAYVGKSITKIRVAIGTFPNNPDAKVFLANSLGGTEIVLQSVTFTANAWNEFTLSTPYTIPANTDVFIGYQLTTSQGYYPLYYDESSTPNAQGVYIKNGSTAWSSLYTNGYYNWSIGAIVDGVPDVSEISLDALSYYPIIAADSSIVISGLVKNKGSVNIDYYEVEYQIGSGTAITSTITNADLSFGLSDYFTLTIPQHGIAELATFQIKVKNPNHIADNETDNVKSGEIIFYDKSNNTHQRTVLLEHFTTAQCSNCPWAHQMWNTVLATRPNVAYVSHHVGYYTDDFTITESNQYMAFYNDGGSTYAPASMLDRTQLTDDPGPIFLPSPQALVESVVDHQLALPPFVTIDAAVNYNSSNKTYTISATTSKIQGMPLLSDTRLTVYLTEDGLIGRQVLSTGQYDNNYVHNHVIRRVVSSVWGDVVTFETDGTFTKQYTGTLPATWNASKVKVIAFVSNYNSSVNKRYVYNTKSVVLGDPNSVENITKNADIQTRVENKSIFINENFENAQLFDITGRKIA
ncbi:MAG: Omp28-related outer membrane protein, partial [Paludibacter sp.]|nr:Omp28-related outer membrane protein [Paludibacter sp.]